MQLNTNVVIQPQSTVQYLKSGTLEFENYNIEVVKLFDNTSFLPEFSFEVVPG